MRPRYLTKSRFKLAMECPSKLFYTRKDEYVDNSLDDAFLAALAEGGFQVGELAKLYYPGGHNIETLDYEQALAETNHLLAEENCIIYEAAVKYNDFFIRVDILVKEGNNIDLIEVKSKSTSGTTDAEFVGARGGILSAWKEYVFDIAFQNYVVQKAFPLFNVTPYLMLIDKNAKCPTDGLNQKFKISRDDSGRKYAVASKNISKEDLSEKLLIAINASNVCHQVYAKEYELCGQMIGFSDIIDEFADKYKQDILFEPKISTECKKCQFKANEEEIAAGLKSGYNECFRKALNWQDKDFTEGSIFEIWNCRKTNRFLSEGKIKLSDISVADIDPKGHDKAGLSNSERQWLQIEKAQNKSKNYWIDKDNLRREMSSWIYPLHFIDFETAMPAIPFNKGRNPYEGIAFQFSHHTVAKDGTVQHKGEYLNTTPGVNPNYEFVRKLKLELENDNGSIFRYAAHENSYLNMIYNQLMSDESNIEDRSELCNFIREITEYNTDGMKFAGARNMVDMLELVRRYYYDPHMKGSNSIKVVLPAVLNSSEFLQKKYSRPIYGAKDGIKSLNFEDWTWLRIEEGQVLDPYSLLPKLFEDISEENYDSIYLEADEINEGGLAMTAYARLQFEEIPSEIRRSIERGLLKYCELDTLAMVMIYEAWKDMVSD